jgi:hypothetical protein
MRLLLALLLAAALAGCLWRGYGRILEIHLQVLQSMAAKMCGLTAGPPPASESMGEFSYPARRARELEQRFESRAGQESYRSFAALTRRYEALVQTFDKARATEETWRASAATVCADSHAIEAAAADVRRQLEAES